MNLPPQHLGASLAQRTQQDAQVTSNVNAMTPPMQTQGAAGMTDQARSEMTAVKSAEHNNLQALQAAAAEQMQRNTLAELSPAQLFALERKAEVARQIGATGAMEELGQHIVRNELQKLGLA